MFHLIIANLKTRSFRTLISAIGVAIGVVLIILFTGLARGLTNDMTRRASNWKAEIVFTRPGAMELTSSNANVSTKYAEKLLEIEGVAETVPIIRYVTPSQKGRWGIQQLDGVEWKPFSAMNEITLTEGRAPESLEEVVVDERQLREDKLSIGSLIPLFGDRQYKVVGVFAPPSGSRIKMSLAAMQYALEAPGKCTFILVKLKQGADVEAVAKTINETLPGNKVNLTRDLIIDAEDRVPLLKAFLRVLVLLGAFVSIVFVLLSMYTTITERRKEIGILKSLGASKTLIISTIESEALMIGIFGILLGGAISLIAAFSIRRIFELQFEFSFGWILTAIAIAIGGSLIGALYPAWRASDIDPVEVMLNE